MSDSSSFLDDVEKEGCTKWFPKYKTNKKSSREWGLNYIKVFALFGSRISIYLPTQVDVYKATRHTNTYTWHTQSFRDDDVHKSQYVVMTRRKAY